MNLYRCLILLVSILFFGAAALTAADPEPVVAEEVQTFEGSAPRIEMEFEDAPESGVNPGTFYFISSNFEAAEKVTKGAPYSAEAVTERIQMLSDGNRIVHKNTSRLYRDAEGRTRREQEFGMIGNLVSAEEPPLNIFINDPVAGEHYVLDPKEQTARKVKLGKPHTKIMKAPKPGEKFEREIVADHIVVAPEASPAVKHVMKFDRKAGDFKTEQLGKQVMEGIDVEGTRSIHTIPAGEIGNERPIEVITEKWFSPELNVLVMTKHIDPRFGETTYRLTAINKGDQDPSLFQIPAGYKVEDGEPGHSIMIKKKTVLKDKENQN